MSAWIVETLIATTLLMGLVLLVRERVAMRFGARIAYLLWLLPALRMVLPPLPESFGPAPLAQLPVIIDLSAFAGAAPLAAAPAAPDFPWFTALLALWLAGAVVHLGWHLIAYRRFVTEAMLGRTDLPELDARGIEVCASRVVEGPFATGIFLPTIVLPHDYRTRYTREELRLAMRHESIHHDRGDLSVNLLALVMLSIHWFNPVAHRAWRAFRTDQELACDAVVLDGATSEERHSYGLALVKSACKRTPVAACSLNPREQLKKRLRMMKVAAERRRSGGLLAAILVGGGLVLTASGGIASETTREIRREVTEKVIAPAVEAVALVRSAPVAPKAPSALTAPATPVSLKAPLPPIAPLGPLSPVAPEAPVAPVAPEVPIAREDVAIAWKDPMLVRVVPGGFVFAGDAHGRCKDKANSTDTNVVVTSHNGKQKHQTRVLVCGNGLSESQIQRISLKAMVTARKGLSESRSLEAAHRASALAAMDAEIASLKAEIR